MTGVSSAFVRQLLCNRRVCFTYSSLHNQHRSRRINQQKKRGKCGCGTASWGSRPQPTSRSPSITKPRCIAVQPIGGHDPLVDSYISIFRLSDRYRGFLSSSVDYFITVVRVSYVFRCTTDTAAIVPANRKYVGNKCCCCGTACWRSRPPRGGLLYFAVQRSLVNLSFTL